MDWANERFVRLYTRDTPEWLCWSWQARALWPHLIRKADRSGVIANRLGARGLAALVGLPLELVEAALPDLMADGCLQEHQLGYVIPNYIEAQETPQSDKQRQRESRERRRVVTNRDSESRNVTERHAASRDVTPIRSDPSRSGSDLSLPRAIPQVVQEQHHPAGGAGPAAPAPDLGPIASTTAELAAELRDRAATVPAVSPPAPVREDIATKRPIAGDHVEASKPTAPSGVSSTCDDQQAIADRDVKPANAPTLDQLWTELEDARQRAAAHHRVTLGPLLAHDARRHDLANLLAEAARAGQRPRLVGQIRHAIAVAEAEAIADRDQLQWLSGAVFSERNFGRLVAAPAPRKQRRPLARAPDPPRHEIPRDQLAGPEQFAEARALLAAVTSHDDDTPDDKPRRRKAAT